ILSVDAYGNANLLCAQNVSLPQTATIESVSFYVATAAGNLRLGIYDATGPSGGPGAKLAETNAMVPIVGWNTVDVITPVSLLAGTYWIAYLTDNNGLHFRNISSGASNKNYSFTYGVLPATFSTSPGGGSAHWSFYANFNSPYIVGSLVGSPTIAVFQTYSAIQVSATASIGSSIPSV